MPGERGARGREIVVGSQEARENDLARRPSRERRGDSEQGAETSHVARDDHDRPLPLLVGPALRCQGRVLAENRLLEGLQGRARLDAQLVDEQPSRLPIDLEGLGLPARAVEGAHELRAKPLAERVLADERLELPDEIGVTAELEVGFDSALEGGETELLEPEDLSLGERLACEIGQCRPAPEAESVAKEPSCELGRGLVEPPRRAVRSGAGRARLGRPGSDSRGRA